MIDITKSRFLKYILFANLYFIQGIILTIAWVILPIYLIDRGVSLPVTTLVIGFVMIPWSIKFVWGGIVDYFIRFGRKIFIIIGGILFASGLFVSAFIDPGIYLIPFSFFMFISVSGVIFLDVAADAWAIESSDEEERGKISGSMFAGQHSGMASSSFLLSFIAQKYSYTYSFIVAGILVILVIIFPLFFKEIKTIRKSGKMGYILIDEFRRRKTQLISFFSFVLYINIGIILLAVPLYMRVSLMLDIAQIGFIVAIFPIMTAIGSLFGGAMADKIGRKKILYFFIGASILFTAILLFVNSWQLLALFYGIIGFLYGGYLTVNVAVLMDITNKQVGAAQFSILTSLANAGFIGGNTISGYMVTLLGFGRVFLYSAWFLGPAILFLYFIKLKEKIRNI
jgi:PAT family beta-lactamase induction signal transducer AmpG